MMTLCHRPSVVDSTTVNTVLFAKTWIGSPSAIGPVNTRAPLIEFTLKMATLVALGVAGIGAETATTGAAAAAAAAAVAAANFDWSQLLPS